MAGGYGILVDEATLCQFAFLSAFQLVPLVVAFHHVQVQIGGSHGDVLGIRGIKGGTGIALEQPAHIGYIVHQTEGADAERPLGKVREDGGLRRF